MPFHYWSSWISLRMIRNHVTSNCSLNHFWSTLKLFEPDQKWNFVQLMIMNSTYLKKCFWSSLNNFKVDQKWFKEQFEVTWLQSRDYGYFGDKFSWINSETTCICVMWPIQKWIKSTFSSSWKSRDHFLKFILINGEFKPTLYHWLLLNDLFPEVTPI